MIGDGPTGVDPWRSLRAGAACVDEPLSAVQDLVTNLEEQARENSRLRETLEQIASMIDRVR